MCYKFDIISKRVNEMNDLYKSLEKKLKGCRIRFPKQSPFMIGSMLLLLGSVYFLILAKIPENPFYYLLVLVPVYLRVITIWSMSDFPQENIENTFRSIDISVKQKLVLRKQRILKKIKENQDLRVFDDLMMELNAVAIGEHSLFINIENENRRIVLKDFLAAE